MDGNTMLVVVIGLFVLIVLGVALLNRGTTRVKIGGPGNTGLELEGSVPQTPQQARGVTQEDVEGRNVRAIDEVGNRVEQRRISATGDVEARTQQPAARDPKAGPPRR